MNLVAIQYTGNKAIKNDNVSTIPENQIGKSKYKRAKWVGDEDIQKVPDYIAEVLLQYPRVWRVPPKSQYFEGTETTETKEVTVEDVAELNEVVKATEEKPNPDGLDPVRDAFLGLTPESNARITEPADVTLSEDGVSITPVKEEKQETVATPEPAVPAIDKMSSKDLEVYARENFDVELDRRRKTGTLRKQVSALRKVKGMKGSLSETEIKRILKMK